MPRTFQAESGFEPRLPVWLTARSEVSLSCHTSPEHPTETWKGTGCGEHRAQAGGARQPRPALDGVTTAVTLISGGGVHSGEAHSPVGEPSP